jgi:hypothetical protein
MKKNTFAAVSMLIALGTAWGSSASAAAQTANIATAAIPQQASVAAETQQPGDPEETHPETTTVVYSPTVMTDFKNRPLKVGETVTVRFYDTENPTADLRIDPYEYSENVKIDLLEGENGFTITALTPGMSYVDVWGLGGLYSYSLHCPVYVPAEPETVKQAKELVQARISGQLAEQKTDAWYADAQFRIDPSEVHLADGTEDHIEVLSGYSAYAECDLRGYLAANGIDPDILIVEDDLSARTLIHLVTGDCDRNGEISAEDAQNVLLAYTESLAGTAIPYRAVYVADVDFDYRITAADAQYTLKYYVLNTVLDEQTEWSELIPHNE